MKKKRITGTPVIFLILLTVLGMALRLCGFSFEGVDYRASLLPWFEDFQKYPGLTGLAHFQGDYNIPYVTLLCVLSWLPVPPIVSIKMSSILFDYFTAILLAVMVKEASPQEQKLKNSLLAYGIFLCSPVTVINSGYLAQCESMWTALALLSFWLILKDHPAAGMLCFGFAFAVKPQGVFILPLLLILYFYKRSFSLLHFFWIPVGIELLCIPGIIGGCSPDVFYRFFKMMMGHYPFVYYYYPNFWTYLKEAPYYVFGKVAIFSAFLVLLIFAILFVKSRRKHSMGDYLEYISFTSMTCAMILPCMHERYNYMGETVLAACAILRPRYRLPALLLVLASAQCNGASYLGWPEISHDMLAACNIAVYFYLAWHCLGSLYREARKQEALQLAAGSFLDREDKAKGRRIPAWEKPLLEGLEKHMLLLAVLVMSVLALYLRKVAVWWNYENIMGHFDRHVNHTESSFYYLLLKMVEYIPILPLHSFKWLGGLSDFALAAVCARIAGGQSRLKQSILYMLVLFSPAVFLRGIAWAQPDSAALSLLLTAFLLQKRFDSGRNRGIDVLCVLLAGMSIAITPCLLVVLLVYMILRCRKSTFAVCLGVMATVLFLQAVSVLALKETVAEGFYSIFRFGTYHPLTGVRYEAPGEWLVQMLILFGLPASCLSLLYAARNVRITQEEQGESEKRTGVSGGYAPLLTAMAAQFAVTLLYGSTLFF